MHIVTYIFGPQTIGIIIYLVGVISQKFPPKKINYLYGYRTASSMKNQQTWDDANRFSSRLMAKMGMMIFIIGIVISIAVNAFIESYKTQMVVLTGLLLVSTPMLVAILMTKTERHLEKTFDKQDEVR